MELLWQFICLCGMMPCIELSKAQIGLLDAAMRLAYTRSIDARVVRGVPFQTFRDALVAPMVRAIVGGETDAWRIARFGLFSVCEAVAFRKMSAASHSAVAA
jgi:hypothetical protein